MTRLFRYSTSMLMLIPALALADTPRATEFDSTMLMRLPNQSTVDIHRFSQSGAVVAGTYRLDVYVNGDWRGVADVRYIDTKNSKNAQLCINEAIVQKLDTKPDFNKKITAKMDNNGCYLTDSLKSELNLSAMRIHINIPQAHLIKHPSDYTDPTTWDKGVNSAFVSYQYNHYHSENKNNGQSNNEQYLSLDTGVNLDRWHFRHQGYVNDNSQNKDDRHYQALNTYVNTDIPSLNGQLTLGDFYADSTLFESNAMRGVQLSSDDRMLPLSMQGYAPVIRGVAKSNAKVSIFQHNQEIYSTTVPAGAFELNNIRSIGGSGDLTIVITESDGRQTRQIVPYSNAVTLLRPNHYRYNYAFGRIRYQNTHLYQNHILQGTWQQGLTNLITMNAGVQYSPHYKSVLLGGAVNTPIGAFAVNGIGTNYTPYNQSNDKNGDENGYQVRLQYHHLIPYTTTHFNASLRYYHNYRNLDEIVQSHDKQKSLNLYRPKYLYQLSFNQPLGKKWGNLYGFFSRSANDNQQGENQWQLGYNNHIGSLNYGVSAQTTKTDNDKSDTQYVLNVSMPLGHHTNHQINSSLIGNDHNTQSQLNISGTPKILPNLSYGITASQQDRQDGPTTNSWSVNTNYQLPSTKLSASYSDYGDGRQYSLGASGAVVAHKDGIISTNQLGDTFAIVHLPNGKGATLENGNNIKFNRQGYAILPYLSPYHNNTLTINPEGLPMEVQLNETGQQVAPIANASVLVKFNSTVGKMALLTIKLANGAYPQIGANVKNQDGVAVGFVAQDGRVFLQDAEDDGLLRIELANGGYCQTHYQLPQQTTTPIHTINAICY